MGTSDSFTGVKWSEREAHLSTPSSVELRMSRILPPLTLVQGVVNKLETSVLSFPKCVEPTCFT
jgi:hypothetical protein